MSELVRRDANAERLGDAFDDLTAQRSLGFVIFALTREQPGIITATEARPERSQVTREHIAHHLWQRVFQRFAVFDVLGFFFPRWLATPPSSRTPALACAACQG
jgi:hypothetical protein